jgi:hypothetical protein
VNKWTERLEFAGAVLWICLLAHVVRDAVRVERQRRAAQAQILSLQKLVFAAGDSERCAVSSDESHCCAEWTEHDAGCAFCERKS